MLYRIFTEDKNHENIEKIASKYFDGFTIIKGQGFWRLQPENSLILEIVTAARKAKIEEYLANEVNIYNEYLTGEVFGYDVICTYCGKFLDSCWGFYGRKWNGNGLLDYDDGFECNCEQSQQLIFPELMEAVNE